MSSTTTILRSHRVVTPHGVEPCDVCIQDGKIKEVLPFGKASGESIQRVDPLVISPGIVDCHVHINEPGRTEWEGFQTATHAAAAGGITTLADMPLNCIPVTTTLSAFQQKLKACESQLMVDCAFWGGLVPGNISDLDPLMNAGISGFKAFLIHSGIDDFPNATESDLKAGMPLIARKNLPLLVHAELNCSESSPEILERSQTPYSSYLASRPKKWELDAIALVIRLARKTKCPVHIVHLSCADALPMLEAARDEGISITVETCSHYLTLCAEEIPIGDTRFKCAPPIREKSNAERLWKGLERGVIDCVVSDHSPCTPDLKRMEQGDFQGAWGGISSLQIGLSLIWTEARKRGYSLSQMTRWMSENPAKLLRLDQRKGAIARGYDADLVLWNPEESFLVTSSIIQHRHKVTPYEGKTLYGKIHQTLLRGQTIYQEGTFSSPFGKPILNPSHFIQESTL
ncbi:MAG: allantoinase AllB [Planctomycetota bacterium]